MNKWFNRLFQLNSNGTTVKREVMAGAIGFFTIVYIIAVNSLILSEAGIPLEAAIFATIITSVVGCLIMGFWANVPILLVPGMGINALFSYTMVQSMGLSWQEALAVVFISGLIFVFVAFSRFAQTLSESIPHSLKEAITVGLGLFLMLIGLEKGGIVEKGTNSIIALGELGDPQVLATILTFLLAIILFMRNVPGNFLITVVAGTLIAWAFGLIDVQKTDEKSFALSDYMEVFGAMSFDNLLSVTFWIAIFSLTMVLVFENIGLVHGHVGFINRPEQFKRAFQANSVSALLSGIFGTSPTVATVESAASMAAGGRTGLTAVTTGMLFVLSAFFIPVIKLIPNSAIAPILIIIGGLMLQNIRNLDLKDMSESFPAIFIIAMIPFTYSIADGIAIGFILYPILKISIGKAKEVSFALYVIAALFLFNFVFHVIS
ncbi:NCS2 family permease [Cytobacillus firmus]|jgi:AGZA family xanthine/uracil permease-like MFS transporter|uniref:NCS2 family permease n=1 Tax=Cytobacillus firmus TaxID=1399 RepID=A0A0J5VII2_CYTFI|nr:MULTISPECIES: NCS2 family permease [Bacillaceae]KML36894.1 permease [Cytobacillus firmus]MBG9445230.1 permease [Cytobacillus firmus]MBG9449028.1 permease [Cytobacillus firmus]MBG9542703.1 permease [Cytobacillus firmus]MBG9553176.1 permease [Cytobacillus firmus]